MSSKLHSIDAAKEVLLELHARANRPDLYASAFKEQRDFITDPAPLKAALCTRRAGKSYGIGLYLVSEALEHPGVSLAYLALTRASATRIMQKDIFQPIFKKFKIKHSINRNENSITFQNGSVIYLYGMDANPREPEKLLGQKYRLVIIDEAGSFRYDLKKMVYGHLLPMMQDHNGTIALIGTPQNLTHTRDENGDFVPSLFFSVTTGKEDGWSVHKWSAINNPHIDWQKTIDDIKKRNALILNTPLFKQHYLGEWVIDDSQLVYRFDSKNNIITTIPEQEYTYILGIDLGYNDDTAFVVVAYTPHDPTLYVVYAYKQSRMIDDHIIQHIRKLERIYPITKYITDPASKQLIESMRSRSQIPFEPAQKQDKERFISLMNSDFITQNIKLLHPQTSQLEDEYKGLVWENKNGKRQENASCANHLTDAALYAWRFSYHHLHQAKPLPKPIPQSEDAVKAFWKREEEKLNKEEEPFWIRDWESEQ